MPVRLYGRTRGWSSYAQVTRGFEHAFAGAGLLRGTISVDDQDDVDFDEDPPPGAGASHGIYTGPPTLVASLVHNAAHEHRWGMLAPNSSRVPNIIVQQYEEVCTAMLAPSAWAAEQLRPLTKLKVLAVPHGIHDALGSDEEDAMRLLKSYRDGRFRVLHLSTSDRERKGTLQLIMAWQKLYREQVLPQKAQLTLLLDRMAISALLQRLDDWQLSLGPNVQLQQRLGGGEGGSPSDMAQLYRSHHVVCQPSRGEAFGLVPLEARACGTVVAATSCSGHSEHMPERPEAHGVVAIEHGELASIDDLPDAVAPSVSEQAVREGLTKAYQHWEELQLRSLASASRVRQQWLWDKQLAPLIKAVGGNDVGAD